jgi:hypothetical protein
MATDKGGHWIGSVVDAYVLLGICVTEKANDSNTGRMPDLTMLAFGLHRDAQCRTH